MANFHFLVFSNPAAGRDAEFNDWYDYVHLGEVLEVPSFVAASRYRIAPSPEGAPRHQYLAVYEMDVADPAATLAELTARAGDGLIAMSDSLASDVETRVYEVVTPRRTAG
jgi:hypothetical protein